MLLDKGGPLEREGESGAPYIRRYSTTIGSSCYFLTHSGHWVRLTDTGPVHRLVCIPTKLS